MSGLKGGEGEGVAKEGGDGQDAEEDEADEEEDEEDEEVDEEDEEDEEEEEEEEDEDEEEEEEEWFIDPFEVMFSSVSAANFSAEAEASSERLAGVEDWPRFRLGLSTFLGFSLGTGILSPPKMRARCCLSSSEKRNEGSTSIWKVTIKFPASCPSPRGIPWPLSFCVSPVLKILLGGEVNRRKRPSKCRIRISNPIND